MKKPINEDGIDFDPENDLEMDAFADKLAEDQLEGDFFN